MLTGKKIKLLRQIHGYTQEELASKIGRTRALVSHIEQSDKVNHDTLLLILKLFGLSEEEFKRFDNNDLKKPKSKDYSTNEEPVLQLKEKLTGYQKENEMLKDIVESQKEIIKLLKDTSEEYPKENYDDLLDWMWDIFTDVYEKIGDKGFEVDYTNLKKKYDYVLRDIWGPSDYPTNDEMMGFSF
jgi:transcriptional regulator with XRE-family HTH domain